MVFELKLELTIMIDIDFSDSFIKMLFKKYIEINTLCNLTICFSYKFDFVIEIHASPISLHVSQSCGRLY